MNLLIVNLPDLPGHTVVCKFEETATEDVACYVMNVNEVDMRNIPANPGEQYRVPLDARVTSNLVSALREMIMRGQG